MRIKAYVKYKLWDTAYQLKYNVTIKIKKSNRPRVKLRNPM